MSGRTGCRRLAVLAAVGAVALGGGRAGAQAPYGYRLNNGQVAPGYRAGYGYGSNPFAGANLGYGLGYGYSGYGQGFGLGGYPYGNGGYGNYGYRGYNSTPRPQTVTNFQPLIGAITSLPGWYGPSGHPHRPVRPKPSVPQADLLADDGSVRWPTAAPDDAERKEAEAAVKSVVSEQKTYGEATVRRVVEARNKLSAYAEHAVNGLRQSNPADADGLERFVLELKKTLATLAVNY